LTATPSRSAACPHGTLSQKLNPAPFQTLTPCAASTGSGSENLPKKPEPTWTTNRNTRTNPDKSGKIRVNPAKSGQKTKIKKIPGSGDGDRKRKNLLSTARLRLALQPR
jgi:hypothetical protein